MQIYFKRKRRGIKPPSEKTIEFGNFLLQNKEYIEMTFYIVSTHDKPENIGKIKRRFSLYLKQHGLIGNIHLNKYQIHLNEFYNIDENGLKKRRGDLLELLVQNIKPIYIKSEEYKSYTECHIYKDKQMIKHADIDVVNESTDKKKAELIECKANLKRQLGEKITGKIKNKLDFMNEVKSISEDLNLDYGLFLATCLSDDIECNMVLEENGYGNFKVITSMDIIKNLK